jgi:hypothetical protein
MEKILGFNQYFKKVNPIEKIEESEFSPILEEEKTESKIDFSEFVNRFSERIDSIGKSIGEKSSENKNPWGEITTGFQDKVEGNKFREWVNKQKPDFKDSKGQKLNKSGEFDNYAIREAYGKYKEEYGFSKKEGDSFRKWWNSNDTRKEKTFDGNKLDPEGPSNNSTIKKAYKDSKSDWDKEWK